MKKCTKCNAEKPLNEFTKSKSTKDGLSYRCKRCAKRMRAHYDYKEYYESKKRRNKRMEG